MVFCQIIRTMCIGYFGSFRTGGRILTFISALSEPNLIFSVDPPHCCWMSNRELESRDLESDSQEGELDVLQTELNEELASLAELVAAREDAARTRQQERANRQLAVTKACSTLREAEEKDAKCHELSKRKLQQNQEIKDRIIKYEEAKTKSIEELDDIKSNFTNELKKAEDILLKKVGEVKKQMEEKIRNRTS